MKHYSLLGLLTVLASTVSMVFAAGNNELHRPPYDFLMGNHIDTHMENKLQNDGSLKGRLYIIFTGAIDEMTGLPVARHPRGAGDHNEECGVDPIDCVVGWNVRAVSAQAEFISHSGATGDDHPIWLIRTRSAIPQPGSYTHFHWITTTSSDVDRLGDVPVECDVANAGDLEGTVASGELTLTGDGLAHEWSDVAVHVGDGAEGVTCPGWLLEITAIRKFAFEHGGEIIPVSQGVDNATHLNIVTNYALVPVVSGDDGGGGH